MANRLETKVKKLEVSFAPTKTRIVHKNDWYYGNLDAWYESEEPIIYRTLKDYYKDLNEEAPDGKQI